MSLLNVVQSGIKVADKVTKPLQSTVSYRRFISADSEGAQTFKPPVNVPALPLKAIVEWKKVQLRTASGIVSATRPTILFLDVAALVSATSGEGIGDEDSITLPDGTTGPISNLGGFIDAGTGKPLATTVVLG